jgi:hypothetical protein
MNALGETVTITVHGAQVTIPSATIADLWLEKISHEKQLTLRLPGDDARNGHAFVGVRDDPPAIGRYWPGQGGIYAGVVAGRDGDGIFELDYHLILEHEQDRAEITWQPALEWARSIDRDGHRDFDLPTRSEQAILFGNVPALFEHSWYWSNTPHASGSHYAWCHYFADGLQSYYREANAFRARAVRRLKIQ